MNPTYLTIKRQSNQILGLIWAQMKGGGVMGEGTIRRVKEGSAGTQMSCKPLTAIKPYNPWLFEVIIKGLALPK